MLVTISLKFLLVLIRQQYNLPSDGEVPGTQAGLAGAGHQLGSVLAAGAHCGEGTGQTCNLQALHSALSAFTPSTCFSSLAAFWCASQPCLA